MPRRRHHRKSAGGDGISASTRIADIKRTLRHFAFVPNSDIRRQQKGRLVKRRPFHLLVDVLFAEQDLARQGPVDAQRELMDAAIFYLVPVSPIPILLGVTDEPTTI